jgi:thioredoxin-dependent peroxiredoxin
MASSVSQADQYLGTSRFSAETSILIVMMLPEALVFLSLFSAELLAPGAQAPDFTLSDQDGNPVNLASLKGKNVVLVFYPMDETPTCTTQLCEFRDRWGDVQAKNTLVFGVNPGSAAKHQKFKKTKAFPFPLLVDEKQKVAKLYRTDGWLVPSRSVYLIGKDGRVKFAKSGKPAPEEVLRAAD